MKKINLLFLTFLLVGCNNNKITGTWENIIAQDTIATHGGKVNPFNTIMSLKYFINDKIENKEQVKEDVTNYYQSRVLDLHVKFDRHNQYFVDRNDQSKGKKVNIKNVNDSLNSGEFIKVEKETFDLLKLGVEYTKYTNGYFNIFSGGVTDFWDKSFYYAENGDGSYDPYFNKDREIELANIVKCVPSVSQIDEVLIFNEDDCSVKFNSLKDSNGNLLDNISITVGGIAKGYATDILKKELLEKGYDTGYLFSGGSSVSSLSKPIYDNKKGQYLSVLDPRTARNLFEKKEAFGIYLKDEFSMSTSGNYTSGKSYRFLDKNGEYVSRHHIINSYTGYPMQNFASVSIFSKKLDAGILDAFSTTLVNMDLEQGLEFRRKVMNDFNADLEIVYIKENIKEETIEIISTSNFDKSLEVSNSKGIKLTYVE